MTFDVAHLFPNLEKRDDDIWFSCQQGPVSYPAHGHAACLQVEDRSFWFRHRNRCIVSVVRRFAPAGGLLFDIGGGNGYVSKGLTDAGITCVLAEPGLDGAVAARARGVDPVLCTRLEDLDTAAGKIDMIGMFDVLEHIEDESGALGRVRTLLQPDGLLFLTVPAYNALHSADDVAAGHFRRYTVRSLRHALVDNGFTLRYTTYLFAPLPPLVLLLRTLPSRLGLRRPADSDEQAEAAHVHEGISARAINALLDREAHRIESGRSIPFGTSCLAVASKS